MNPPKPWIAAGLSLLAPGLGHLYSGHVMRAVIIVLLLEILTFLLALLFVAGPITLALVLAAPIAAVAVFILIAIDAGRLAKRGRVTFSRRAFLVGSMVLFILVFVVVGEPLRELRNRVLGQAYRMPSGAMFPSLLIGDHFFSNRLPYLSREPQRGDVVIVVVGREGSSTYPADRRPGLPPETIVKRVVGIPGDSVAFEGAHLFINGVQRTGAPTGSEFVDPEGGHLRVLSETLDGKQYQVLDSPGHDLPDFGPMVVEPGRFFIAGDNRDHSKDSRIFGTVGRQHVLAPVSRVYWSWDFNGIYAELLNPIHLFHLLRERTRWSRIGMSIN